MAKPIMSYEAVIAAAREAHLHGGQEVDLQALSGKPHDACYYGSDQLAPAHCKTTVCVIGAFLWKHDLLDVRVGIGPDRGMIRSKMAVINKFPALRDLVDIPDMDRIRMLQKLHDRACQWGADLHDFRESRDSARIELREALGLEPA